MKVKSILAILLVTVIALSAEDVYAVPGWSTHNSGGERFWYAANTPQIPAQNETDLIRVSEGNGESFLIKENALLAEEPGEFKARITLTNYQENGGIVFNWNGTDDYYYIAMRLLSEGDNRREIAIFKNSIPRGSSSWETTPGLLYSYGLIGSSPFQVPFEVNTKTITVTLKISTSQMVIVQFNDDDGINGGFGFAVEEPISVDSKIGFAHSSIFTGNKTMYQFISWKSGFIPKPKPVRGSAYFF